MREGTVTANGISFAYLEEGDGPLVLLLHGFPDNAHTWSHQMPAIARAGYRVVAPFTRGYHPSGTGEFYDVATLATDARALIEGLAGEPSHVVGHDWGAATTFTLIAAYPEVVRRAVTMAIPHPLLVARAFTNPASIHRAFHFWFFQMAGLPEAAIRENNFAFIDYLWSFWSPALEDSEHVAGVKETLAAPGALEAALGYYRSMFEPARQDPALLGARARLFEPITVPTLNVLGSADLTRTEPPENQAAFFSAPFRFESVPGAGHFLHREQPEAVTKQILDWLAG